MSSLACGLLSCLFGAFATLQPVSVMNGPLSQVVYSPDGTLLALGGMQGDVVVLAVDGWAERGRFKPSSSRVNDLCFNHDNSLLAITGLDKTIRITTLAGEERTRIEEDGWGLSVSFHPDGDRLVGSFADGRVRLYETVGGQVVWTSDLEGSQSTVRFSPSGDRIACAAAQMPGAVVLLDSANGQELARNATFRGNLEFLSYAPDGQALIASGSGGGNMPNMIVMDPATAATVHDFESLMTDGALSPDGELLVGLGGDGELRVFEVGARQRRFKGNPLLPDVRPNQAALSPDGHILIVAGDLPLLQKYGFYPVPVELLK